MALNSKLISIVVPVCNERNNLESLYFRIKKLFHNTTYQFELIFIDDGSDDGSLEIIERLCQQDSAVKFLSFSRNFGHQIALSAGLDVADGNAVVLMDADLEHPPEVIPALLDKWREGFKNVYTIRKAEKVSLFKRYSSRIFYRVFHALTKLNIPINSADFRLLDRDAVLEIRKIHERNRFLRGLIFWTGFASIGIDYEQPPRLAGKIKYDFKRMLLFAIDAICSFTITPLYIGILVGVLVAFLGFVYGAYALYVYLFAGTGVPGWASIISLLGILGGIQLIVIGLIGIYVGKIFEEVKQRPLYIIRSSRGIDESRIPQ